MHWKDHYDSPIEHMNRKGMACVEIKGDLLGGCNMAGEKMMVIWIRGYRMRWSLGSRYILEREQKGFLIPLKVSFLGLSMCERWYYFW